jgi:hypothetical protein
MKMALEIDNYRELATELEHEGWESSEARKALESGRTEIEHLRCEQCRGQLAYRLWEREADGDEFDTKAFAVCLDCNLATDLS